ncbi:MAG: hypothetical protein IT233_09215 [Bacteroidia bacterium]|nr:hypothetical protein [Bacteroidia bacterium]
MRAKYFYFSIMLLCFAIIIVNSCTKDRGELDFSSKGFPQEVGEIIVKKCATSGCHDDISKEATGGLSLETWDKMFKGSRAGAVVIPYRPDFSTLIYYTNSFNEFGTIQLTPKMPVGNSALTYDEMKILYDWVIAGAPNADGFVKFSDNPNRKKFYAGNQGCDEVTVFDAQSMLAMRYAKVGATGNTEAPHMVKVAPNNQFWCASYLGGSYFQKFSVSDNSLLGQVNITAGSWNTFAISSNSQTAYVVDWSGGRFAIVNLSAMTAQLITGFVFPHGSALNASSDTLYLTAQTGNFVYKIPVNDIGNYEEKSMDGNPPMVGNSLNIHEILFSPDNSKYFITCQMTNEIRVIKKSNDNVLSVIPVGVYPQEMGVSTIYPYLFVSCTEDNLTFPGKTGSVYVINYNTNSVVATIYAGHQSHGVAVDDVNKRVYITNRNVTNGGPAPHHSSVCGGRNGYVTAIDMNTLQLIQGYKAEVSVDPYGAGITH